MKTKKRTRIYALIKNRKVFIGRCAAIKLSAVVYEHCRGEHIQTQNHFNLDLKRPDLYVLEEIENESHVTYRHWLAWIHTFEVAGYKLLHREDVLEDSRDLHPETRQIYERIQMIPLELHLEHGYRSKYSAGDYDHKNTESDQAVAPSAKPYAATEKLSVRLSRPEKELIEFFAKCLNLTLRDAVVYAINNLMYCDNATMAAEQQMYSIRQRYLQNIESLKKKNSELTAQLNKQYQQFSGKAQKHCKQIKAIQTGIYKYFTYLKPDATIPLRIEQARYHNYIHDTEIIYEYPQEEGFAVIRPHAVLWGSTQQVHFLIGETDQGENIMLRYYPAKDLIGMFPGNERFGLRGSCWLIGWEQKEDNVMQLIFSFPLSTHPKYDDPMAVGTELGKLMWEINQYNR